MKNLKIMSMLFIVSALCFGLTSCGPDDEPVEPIDNPSNTNTDNPSNTDNIDYSQVISGHWKNTDVNEDDYEVTLSINYNGTGTICYYDLINDDYQYGVMACGTYSLSGKILTARYDRVEVKDAYYEPFTYHGFSDGKSKIVVYAILSCDGNKLVIKDESGNTSNYEKYGDIEEIVPSLSVSPTSLSFDFAASSKTIDVTANGDYTYSSSASWLSLSRSSDKTTLTVSVEANTGTTDRTATITLTLDTLTRTISVTQKAAANTTYEGRTFTVSGNGKTVTFKMIKVEGGTFEMGASDMGNASPVHSVTLTKDYFMGETEVTQALWYAVMGQSPRSGGYKWNSTEGKGDDWPAYYISYEDCQSFLSALNSRLSSQLGSGEQFRFPTEAEWEFAARGGNKSGGYTYSGSNTIGDVAWYEDNSSSITHPIKTKAANELGLYDMSGNVCERCYDWYGDYSSGAQTDPTGPTSGSYRVYRGGDWRGSTTLCRVAIRYRNSPTSHNNFVGFRLALGSQISEPVPSLSVSPTSLSFGADASSQTLTVTSNGEYTYSTDVSWLTITQSSDKNTLTISTFANTDISDRSATITLTLGSLTQTISVTQEAAANTSYEGRTFTVTGNGKTVSFKMIKVEGGTFQMGSTTGAANEAPVHSVTLTKDYYMCESEVTQALWYAVMGHSPTSGGSQWSSKYGLGDEKPAYYISYKDCQSFLSALNSKLSSQLGGGEQFRFPTEAEWEFAAKGGTKTKGYIFSGSNTIDDVAWYIGNRGSSTAHPVKTKAPNELGLYDMSGNVYEWCYDWWGSYRSDAQTDPTGPTSGSYRVLRGGDWYFFAESCRVTKRLDNTPTTRSGTYGFRLCLGAPLEE